MDIKQNVITKSHLSLQLRWAKKKRNSFITYTVHVVFFINLINMQYFQKFYLKSLLPIVKFLDLHLTCMYILIFPFSS